MSYLYAIVKIPIEIKEDKSYNVLSERIHTTVEKCEELPPVNTDQNNDIISQFKDIIGLSCGESEPESEPEPEPAPEPEPEPEAEAEAEPEIKLILDNPIIKGKKNRTFRSSNMKHNVSKKRIKEINP